MNTILIAIGVIVLVVIVDNLMSSDSTSTRKPFFKKRPSVFNASEMAFFLELKKQLPDGFYIFPKMRIIDFIEPDYRSRSKIWAKHVDFLICDHTFKPVVAIELNGASHLREKVIHSDKLKKNIFESAQLPLRIIEVGMDFDISIRNLIRDMR